MVVSFFKFWSQQSLFTPVPDGKSIAEADNKEGFCGLFSHPSLLFSHYLRIPRVSESEYATE